MSTIGYNGRDIYAALDGDAIAAIASTNFTMNRTAVDVTTRDASGWTTLLPDPGNRNVNATIEGVATEDNYQLILDEWAGQVNSDITLHNGDGSTMEAANGFFLGNVTITGEQDGHVAFTAELQSSGAVTITAATP